MQQQPDIIIAHLKRSVISSNPIQASPFNTVLSNSETCSVSGSQSSAKISGSTMVSAQPLSINEVCRTQGKRRAR